MLSKIFFILNLLFVVQATTFTVNAGNMYYNPENIEIQVGDTVEWYNEGGYHDVVVSSGPESISFSACSSPCNIGSYTFTLPGTYDYICSVGQHAVMGMVGTVTVVESSVEGCMDPNAIRCDEDIDTLYFPECLSCLDSEPCENYYNENATADNGLCMYNDVPTNEEFVISSIDGGFNVDWSLFTPPVAVLQYTLQRCLDPDGDTDGDGYYEYENCSMLIAPMSFNLDTTFDDINEVFTNDVYFAKYTFYVHYPNNNYWGSANAYYLVESESPQCTAGDVSGDGTINVLDVISTVNHIIGTSTLEGEGFCAGDVNGDGVINVTDIVSLINIILS